MLMIFLRPGMFSKTKTFPQCTPYMYVLIYIKGSKVLQTAELNEQNSGDSCFVLDHVTVLTGNSLMWEVLGLAYNYFNLIGSVH